ncbi:MAG TPA: hypothetical protein ENI92_00035, partial [Bacteroidetes bacterium]|nr:hypothetical protein [Bacteroidota bacterium]
MISHCIAGRVAMPLCSILILLAAASTAAAREKKDETKQTYHLDEVYPIAPDGTLLLVTEDADVEIIGSDRSDVHVVVDHTLYVRGVVLRADSTPFEMEVVAEKGNLSIRQVGGDYSVGMIFGSVREDYRVLIEAPKSVNLNLRGDDDDYKIRGMEGELRLRFEDGDARIVSYKGEHVEVECEDGSVEIEGGSGLLEGYSEDGEITVEEGTYREMDLSCEDGDLEIENALADDGTYSLRTEDGDIRFTVLSGGGTFRATFEDGGARADSRFGKVDEDD